VVYKPFDIDNLLANVKQLLGTSEHISSVIEEKREKKK
jgi:DNA-binding response OmpR family regulator